MNFHFTLFFVSILKISYCSNVISVYGDVYKDREFFTNIFPWIINNIGGDISVDYYLLGSGRYAIPQMCALSQLRLNTFLQSQYLQCESEGRPSQECLCNSGIDPQRFKSCVQSNGHWASVNSLKYSQLRLDTTPVVELGPKNTVFGVNSEWYLKKICTIFGENPPRGCVRPFSCCNGTEEAFTGSGVAHFDCNCQCFHSEISSTNTDYYTTDNYWEYNAEIAENLTT